jgi:nucleoside-diphosphate-sugar epimerase
VSTVSSNKGGLDEYREIYLNGSRHLIDWLAPMGLKKFIYTSSTSVYGQTDGGIVDENSPAQPASPTSQVLVDTEQLLLQAARRQNFPAIILRVAGIYGPGRGHLFHQYLRDKARIHGSGERILNMIHREDLVEAISAALHRGQPGEIYNVADDEPVREIDFFRWLSETLRKPMPPTATDEKQRKRGRTSKRVSNHKLRSALGVSLRFPNFRIGYSAEIERTRSVP